MSAADPDVVLTLPEDLRGAFKDPFGPVYTDAESLLDDVSGPLYCVGDVVTYHCLQADRRPDVAVVDGRTEREAVDADIRAALDFADDPIPNPPATLAAPLLTALREGMASEAPTTLVVDGEEDLATLPLLAAAPDGAAVVYGQPGEGMVLVTVDSETRERARDLLARMDGDVERVWDLLGI